MQNADDTKVTPTLPSRITRTIQEVIQCEINMLLYFFRSVQQPELLNTLLSLCELAHDARQSEDYNYSFLKENLRKVKNAFAPDPNY